MKYDDASWHYEGDFPADLPVEAAATHIGMFLAWGMLNGLASAFAVEESSEGIAALEERTITPGKFLINEWDEKLVDDELNDEGNRFALAYYGGPGALGLYISDYEATLSRGEPSLYHIEDTWENYDKLTPVVAGRFAQWKTGKLKPGTQFQFSVKDLIKEKPWWKFW